MKNLMIFGLVLQATSAFAASVQVPNNQAGVDVCKSFLEHALNVPGQLTVKDTATAGLFLLNGNVVGQMTPSEANPGIADCITLE